MPLRCSPADDRRGDIAARSGTKITSDLFLRRESQTCAAAGLEISSGQPFRHRETAVQAIRCWIMLGAAALLTSCAPVYYYAAPPAPVYYRLYQARIDYRPQQASIAHPEWLSTDQEPGHNSKSRKPHHPPVNHNQFARRDENHAGPGNPSHWINPEPDR